MNTPTRAINIFQNGIDLRHLSDCLDQNGFNSLFHDNFKSFITDCKERAYTLIVICGIGEELHTAEMVEALSETKNSVTPVLLIVDNNDTTGIGELLKYHLSVITFPFTTDEFIFRVQAILRDMDMVKTIHTSLNGYRAVIDNLPLAIVQVDNHGDFIRFNERFVTFMEMSEKDINCENFFRLSHPDDYLLERKQLDRLQRREIEHVTYEVRLINNEGKTKVCSVTAAVVWEDSNHFGSFVFVLDTIA